MRISALIFALVLAFVGQASAQSVPRIIHERSDDSVPLNITFNGQEILIFGAIDGAGDEALDLIISVEGPPSEYTIFRKVHRAGMWINGDGVTFRRVPSFLALLSNRPIDEIILPTEQQRYKIGFEEYVRLRGLPAGIEDAPSYRDAFLNIEEEKGNYIEDGNAVKISGGILFSTNVPLASDLIEGNYTINIYLLSKGRVVASVQSNLNVYKSGIERWLFALAQDRGFLYGLLAIFLAISVAFLSNQAMRLFKR